MQVNLHDAKTHLSRYVDQALGGEDVVIARAGTPVARLVALHAGASASGVRLGGLKRARARIDRVFSRMASRLKTSKDSVPQANVRQ